LVGGSLELGTLEVAQLPQETEEDLLGAMEALLDDDGGTWEDAARASSRRQALPAGEEAGTVASPSGSSCAAPGELTAAAARAMVGLLRGRAARFQRDSRGERALTAAIGSAKDWRALRELFVQRQGVLNAVHVGALTARLAGQVARLRPAQLHKQRRELAHFVESLVEAMRGVAPGLDAGGAAFFCHALARLQAACEVRWKPAMLRHMGGRAGALG
jgi:hypothetical protein